MKKSILTAFAALLIAVPAAQAQKVNKEGILSKIEKSDADIADAKKGIKAATWINRGKVFYEAAAEPTKNLFVNMDAAMLKLAIGDPQSTEPATILDAQFEAWVYPYFTAYVRDGKVATWKQTQWILKEAPEKAIEAYNKAAELDPKMATKAKEGLQQVSDYCSQVGNVGLDSGDYVSAADAYMQAYAAQSSPAYGSADPSLLYYAGYLRTIDGSSDPTSFAKGADYLERALAQDYADEEGNIYYYLFHCYYGQKSDDKENVMKAKNILLKGLEKFPKNQRILEGLMQLYTTEEGAGDPADLVAMIDSALAEDPDNVDLWFGRGRIFYALKNPDESVASFLKVVELRPDSFDGNYLLGVFYTVKAEDVLNEINTKQYSSQAAYDEDLKELNAIYAEAVPWLEKAHALNPEDINTLDLLKAICYRLRDEGEGMMEKYEHYNKLFKQAKGLE